jgi:peptide/nickel transport system substrate-binding protein
MDVMTPERGAGTANGSGSLSRRRFLQGAVATGALAATSAVLGPFGASAASTLNSKSRIRKGGDLRVGLTGGSSSDTLNPLETVVFLDVARAQSLYQPLMQLNAQAQNEFVLADEISPHGSASEYVIRLKSGITFHNGKPLGAADVIYTFQQVLNPKDPLAGAAPIDPVDVSGLKALDPLTVLVPMKVPFASFLDQLSSFWYSLYIVPEGWVSTDKPNGTGPFKYQSFTPGVQSVFVRNDNYWKSGLPYVDTLTFLDFSDVTSLQNALISKVVDCAGSLSGVQMKELANNADVKPVPSKTGGFTPFTMRCDQPPFNDVRVRQAFRYIVDRPEIIATTLAGYGSLAADVFAPYDPDYDKKFHREQDIDLAKHLLKKAGYDKNLTVKCVSSSGVDSYAVNTATVFKQQALAAGVTVDLDVVPSGTFFDPGYWLTSKFSQIYWGYSSYLAQVAETCLPTSPFPETHFNNARYIDLYKQANATLSASTRKEIEHEMQTIDFNEGGYIIPCFSDVFDAYSSKLTGYTTSKTGEPLSNFNFEQFGFLA